LSLHEPRFVSTLPALHRGFLDRALPVFSAQPRIAGVAGAGSYASDSMDRFSDLDLVLACEPGQHAGVVASLPSLAASIGGLAGAFTGEHVGEPRLLICLYEEGLHVDLKAVALDDLADRVDDPLVIWERGESMTRALARGEGRYPRPDPQWIEDRFWIWVHYAAMKIGRGELLEATGFLSYLRGTVLGPLGLEALGLTPNGVRRVEAQAPKLAQQLRPTAGALDRESLIAAVRASVCVYRRLRESNRARLREGAAAEEVAMRYLDEVERSGS